MTNYLTALVAEQRHTDMLAEADNYRRTRRANHTREQTTPRSAAREHHWGHAFRAFMKDVATAQL